MSTQDWAVAVLWVVTLYLLWRRIADDLKGPPRWAVTNLDDATAIAKTTGVFVDEDAARIRQIRLSPLAQDSPFMPPISVEALPQVYSSTPEPTRPE